MDEEVNVSQVQEPITTASPEIYQIIERILALEKRDSIKTKYPRFAPKSIM